MRWPLQGAVACGAGYRADAWYGLAFKTYVSDEDECARMEAGAAPEFDHLSRIHSPSQSGRRMRSRAIMTVLSGFFAAGNELKAPDGAVHRPRNACRVRWRRNGGRDLFSERGEREPRLIPIFISRPARRAGIGTLDRADPGSPMSMARGLRTLSTRHRCAAQAADRSSTLPRILHELGRRDLKALAGTYIENDAHPPAGRALLTTRMTEHFRDWTLAPILPMQKLCDGAPQSNGIVAGSGFSSSSLP